MYKLFIYIYENVYIVNIDYRWDSTASHYYSAHRYNFFRRDRTRNNTIFPHKAHVAAVKNSG